MIWIAAALASVDGSPWPEVPYFHHSSLSVRKNPDALYPQVEPEDRRVRHRCMVWVRIGTDGRVAEAKVLPEYAGAGCSQPYQGAAQQAVAQWRWKPHKIDKDKAVVQTQVPVLFLAQATDPVVDVSKTGSPPPEPVKQPKRPQAGRAELEE